MTEQQEQPVVNPGVGMPTALQLDYFGWLVWCAFGQYPYLVGSALYGKAWRDVDVRLLLDDEDYEARGLGKPNFTRANARWVALCQAFAALGKQITGLPIDFQIQQRSYANRVFDKRARSCLGIEFALMRQNLAALDATGKEGE